MQNAYCYNQKYFLQNKLETFAKSNVAYIVQPEKLKNTSRGKYFRIVVKVFSDGVEVSDLLINQNLAHS